MTHHATADCSSCGDVPVELFYRSGTLSNILSSTGVLDLYRK